MCLSRGLSPPAGEEHPWREGLKDQVGEGGGTAGEPGPAAALPPAMPGAPEQPPGDAGIWVGPASTRPALSSQHSAPVWGHMGTRPCPTQPAPNHPAGCSQGLPHRTVAWGGTWHPGAATRLWEVGCWNRQDLPHGPLSLGPASSSCDTPAPLRMACLTPPSLLAATTGCSPSVTAAPSESPSCSPTPASHGAREGSVRSDTSCHHVTLSDPGQRPGD